MSVKEREMARRAVVKRRRWEEDLRVEMVVALMVVGRTCEWYGWWIVGCVCVMGECFGADVT